MQQAISYIRVSTQQQGRSGLGLEAQRDEIKRFCDNELFNIIREYVEVETGKGADALDRRPQLKEALEHGKELACPIIVAKLDRLSRDVHFVSGLMIHKIPFIVAELGKDADSFLLHIWASLAEKERAMISQRTKAALARAKANGRVLGALANGQAVKEAEKASARAQSLADSFSDLSDLSANAAARKLNERGVRTATGAPWSAMTVIRVRRRLNHIAVRDAEPLTVEAAAAADETRGRTGSATLPTAANESSQSRADQTVWFNEDGVIPQETWDETKAKLPRAPSVREV